jgi:hypothetical protein
MAIVSLLNWHEVHVSSRNSINAIFTWMADHKLKIGLDFRFGGQTQDKIPFAFREKQHALLFKLTFGGE